jgi:predicted PurR-regulated permease PerM
MIPRWAFWAAPVLVVVLFVYGVRDILLPFVAGLAVAYLLDPVADRMEKAKLPRWLATLLTLVLFFAFLLFLLLGAAPILADQISSLAQKLPGYIEQVRPFIMRLISEAGGAEEAKRVAGQAGGQIAEYLSGWVADLIKGGLYIFNLISLLLITPIVAFYLLRDWDLLIARIDSWLPKRWEPTIRGLLSEADQALSGFVRGQTLVCLGVAIVYGLGWSLVGLEYGLVLGLLTGMLAFVPYVGQLFGTVVAVVVAIGQFGDNYVAIGLVVSIYFVAQMIESFVLTPKLIGDRVGLHAVWVIFAVMAGAELMGFVGVLIAVPVAAVAAVVGRWLLARYMQTAAYRGDTTTEPPAQPPAQS